jgi:hypothetical protein
MFLSGPLMIGNEDGTFSVASELQNTSLKDRKYAHKRAMEYAHLEHFRIHINNKLPNYTFKVLGVGEDPPDFEIVRNKQKVGIELTMLILEDLRAEVKFFARIQDKLLSEYKLGRLKKLEGIEINLTFGSDETNRPKAIDDVTLNELINSLNKLADKPFEFPTDFSMVDEVQSPYPVTESGVVKNGFINWTVTHIGDIEPRTQFGSIAGFEISHTYKAPKDKILDLLQRIIDTKDVEKNSNFELLISAGMPDKDGWITTIEELCLVFFLDTWEIKQPKYLSKVFLDCWRMRRLHVLYEREKI